MRARLSRLTFVGGLGWLAVLAFVRTGTAPRPWPIELLDTFALYGFLPFGLVALLGVGLRSRLLLGLTLVATALFWYLFGWAFLPGPAIAGSPGPQLRVLTYNVLVKNGDAAPLAELVRREQPDVIVLQELTSIFARSLARELGNDYPYRELADVGDRNDGAGIYSRLPIVQSREFKLSRGGNAFLRVRLQHAGREVWLYNVHLATPRIQTSNPPGPVPLLVRGFGSPSRERELQKLIEETSQLTEPYILAGDFNLGAGSRPYRAFPAAWQDAFAQRGRGFGHTFPTSYKVWSGRIPIKLPLVRIDYVISSPEITALSARIPQVEGSDHLPMLADLLLRAPTP